MTSVDDASPTTSNPISQNSFSEATFVRLVVTAMQGVRTALDETEKLSELFCSTAADRTVHGVSNWWRRSSSPSAFGKLLKSFCRSGHLFSFLSKFVDHFLYFSMDGHYQRVDKEVIFQAQMDTGSRESYPTPHDLEQLLPTYTLVNQAFAVALKSVLDGYICALNTLNASVNVRRSLNYDDNKGQSSPVFNSLSSTMFPDTTLLEVYLHSRELRNQLEVVGNICCQGNGDILDQISRGNSIDSLVDLVFRDFPRGANLLTYLYVQLRDASPTHCHLLKLLFSCSCEPYIGFIKAWIYRGKVDDPYQEFIVEMVDRFDKSDERCRLLDDLCLSSVKERPEVFLPHFLEDMHVPLLRTGQQLQILIKMLDLSNYFANEDFSSSVDSHACSSIRPDDVLPYWNLSFGNSVFSVPSLAFSWEEIRHIRLKREVMYRQLLEKLEILFVALTTRNPDTNTLLDNHNFGPVNGHNKDSLQLLFNESSSHSQCFIVDNGVGAVTTGGMHISSASDGSNYGTDDLQSWESSSTDNYDGEYEDDTHISHVTMKPLDLYSCLWRLHIDSSKLEKMSKKENQSSPVSNQNYEEKNKNFLDDILTGNEVDSFSYSSHTRDSTISHEDDHFIGCWPLGKLLSNPFHTDKNGDRKQMHFDYDLFVAGESKVKWKSYDFQFDQIPVPENLLCPGEFEVDRPRSTFLLNKEYNQPLTFLPPKCIQPWDYSCNYNLSLNPVVTKAMQRCLLYQNAVPARRRLPYFNFSLVEDPCKVFLERLVTNVPTSQYEKIVDEISSGKGDAEDNRCTHEGNKVDRMTQPENHILIPKSHSLGCMAGEVSFASAGGAKWEQLLDYSVERTTNSRNLISNLETTEIPLEVIIDRCIKQEILIQYNYVSSFTIRLLEEGFGLCEHLLALRRYHFMELSDWADLFTVSVWKHNWHLFEHGRRIAQIQTLLEWALQKSSCESDPHRLRLYVYSMEYKNTLHPSTSIGAFDFMKLGYKVDWPLSVVINPEALKVYSDIFSFLIQIRIALFTLSDVWRALKAFIHPNYMTDCSSGSTSVSFSTFLKLRIQVNHFVTTLHQYVQSQLSDVSWCKFFASLKHQVRDMLDLESVHKSYLSDALHICFLSIETRTVSSIIRDILQCALDFRSCITTADPESASDSLGHSGNILANINLSQVLVIKSAFEKSLHNLYLCYLKCPKHSEFGLCRLWNYLNYNDYYGNTISNEIWY